MRKLYYEPLTEEETQTAGSIVHGVMTNERIMETINEFHAVNIRCAVIVVQEEDELREVYVREARDVKWKFPFDEAEEAIDKYDTHNSVCIILVRDAKVCAVLGVAEQSQS